MSKFTGLERPITQAIAEAEPAADRLFAKPPPQRNGRATALLAALDEAPTAGAISLSNRRATGRARPACT
jgi:hypothetical protein